MLVVRPSTGSAAARTAASALVRVRVLDRDQCEKDAAEGVVAARGETSAGPDETEHGVVDAATGEGCGREVEGELAEDARVGQLVHGGRRGQVGLGHHPRRAGEAGSDDLVRGQQDPSRADDDLVARLDAPRQGRGRPCDAQADRQVQRVGREEGEHAFVGAHVDVDTGGEGPEHAARGGCTGDDSGDER